MHQVATRIWNEIAPQAQTTWGHYFELDSSKITVALDQLSASLEARGVSSRVVLAYCVLAPLLHECEAIASYVELNPQWAGALPEILSVDEAIFYSDGDYRLSFSENAELRKLLGEAPPSIADSLRP